MRILLHLFLFHGLCFAAMGAPPADHTTSSKAEVSSQVLQNQAQPLWVIHWNWSTAFALGGSVYGLNTCLTRPCYSHQIFAPLPQCPKSMWPLSFSMVSPTSLYRNEQRIPGHKVYFELEQNEHVWLERMPEHNKAKLWEAREAIKPSTVATK